MPEKKNVKKPKLPGDVHVIKPSPTFNKDKSSLPEEAEKITDSLLSGEWQTFSSRPKRDEKGLFVILRWYNKENLWVPLYASHGLITPQLNKIFSGKDISPIGKYLSSFPRNERKSIWIKWLLEGVYSGLGEKEVDLDDVVKVISQKYNSGEMPPFNFEMEEKLPDNFSILNC